MHREGSFKLKKKNPPPKKNPSISLKGVTSCVVLSHVNSNVSCIFQAMDNFGLGSFVII